MKDRSGGADDVISNLIFSLSICFPVGSPGLPSLKRGASRSSARPNVHV